MIDRIIVNDGTVERLLILAALQVRNFVILDLVAVSLKCRVVTRQPFVATFRRQMLLFLAPHVEIHFMQRVGLVALRADARGNECHGKSRGNDSDGPHAVPPQNCWQPISYRRTPEADFGRFIGAAGQTFETARGNFRVRRKSGRHR